MKQRVSILCRIVSMWCVLWLGVAGAATAAPEATFAVVPFEGFPSQGASHTTAMEAADLLAQRLRAAGAVRVVGPAEFEGKISRRPDAATVKRVGVEQGVIGVLTGRTTRIGTHLSVDVQLYSAASGTVAATLVEEVPNSAALQPALDRIAKRILQIVGSGAKMSPASATLPAAPPTATRTQKEAAEPSKTGSSITASKEPMAITADQLEVLPKNGGRTIVFVGNVKLVQGPLLLTSEKLEAVYAAGASDPERIVATRNVHIAQSGKTVRCDQATYQRKTQRVICRGNAVMQQGIDQAEGEEIEFQLDAERLLIRGGAKVVITPASKPKEQGS